MANTDRAHGFDPFGVIRDLEPVSVDASNGTAIFIGDAVQGEADGNAAPASAANTQIRGVSAGYLAASTAGSVNVYGDPDQRFVAQTNTGSTPTTASLNNTMDHEAGTGSTVTLLSGHELDASGTNNGFLLLDLLNRPDNVMGVHADMVCVINEHWAKTASGV